MKRCNVCGKNISDFASKCPYCGSAQSAGSLDSESMDKKELYSKLNAKKHALINLILSIILIARPLLVTVPTLVELIVEIAYSAYAGFVIVKYNVVSLSRNKLLLICAAIGGIAFSVLQYMFSPYSYGMGIFAVADIPLIQKILVILIYIERGLLLFFAILDAHYLIIGRIKQRE